MVTRRNGQTDYYFEPHRGLAKDDASFKSKLYRS
jgi:hypothetical protein